MTSKLTGPDAFARHAFDFVSALNAPTTKKAYRADIISFVEFWKEEGVYFERVTDLQLRHFVRWRDYLIESGYAPATVNRKMAPLRGMMRFAQSTGLIPHNPLAVLKLPRPDPIRPSSVLSDEQVRKVLALVQEDRPCMRLHKAVLTTLFYTGIRRQELVDLRVGDSYEEKGHQVLRVRGKGGKMRVVPVHPVAHSAICDYLTKSDRELLADEPLFMAAKRWRSRRYTSLSPHTIYYIVCKYVKKARINVRGHPHAARATVITHLVSEDRASLQATAELVGHESVTSTQRYVKRARALSKSAAYGVNYG